MIHHKRLMDLISTDNRLCSQLIDQFDHFLNVYIKHESEYREQFGHLTKQLTMH